MKLHILGQEQDKQGGGWSWISNMKQGFELTSPEECDVYVVSSVSMLSAISDIPKKPLVLRVDNVLKKSTNRDMVYDGRKVTRMEGLKIISDMADMVVYQSTWAMNYLDPYLKAKNKCVILNSSNEKIFNPDGDIIKTDRIVYLYSRSSNHDNKQWHKAWYTFQELHRDNDLELWITGKFSPENVPANFDFFNGERIRYWGFVDKEQMALLFRSANTFMYSYYNDACSNTLIEALLSGCEPMMLEESGGAKEIMDKYNKYGKEYFYLNRMFDEYGKVFDGVNI